MRFVSRSVGPAFAATCLLSLPAPLHAGHDPWKGIIVIVSPADESPYEAAQRAAMEAEEAAEAPAEQILAEGAPGDGEQADIAPFDIDRETAEAPSLWTSLDLGLDFSQLPEPEPPAPNRLLPERKPLATRAAGSTLPTRLDLKEGPASLSVTTSARASAPVSGALEKSAGSGSGEVKGRIGLEQDNLTLYSTGTLGASASTGTPSLYDSLAVGSTYRVPLSPLGLKQEELGASVEVNDAQKLTTGLELRGPAGSYQRFISVQRSQTPDSQASGVLKAGVLGKF